MINGTLCYLVCEGKTLFLERLFGSDDIHNKMCVAPGGKDNRHERGLDCVIREFTEETGLIVKNPILKAIITFDNNGRLKDNGKPFDDDYRVQVYAASEYSGELKAESEKLRPVWVSNKRISELKMHECDRKLLEILDKEGFYEILVQHSGQRLIKFEVSRVA